jgi:hypothetical protein
MAAERRRGWYGCCRLEHAPEPGPRRWAVYAQLYSRSVLLRSVETFEEAERLRDLVYLARAAHHMHSVLPSDIFDFRRESDRKFFYEAWEALEEIEEKAKKTPSYLREQARRRQASENASKSKRGS